MPAAQTIFRFAPSPNGYLHLGHAFSAILNANATRNVGGLFLLRIEDIDQDRARAEFETAIDRDLGWLGLSWQPDVLRQSERFEDYRQAIDDLDRLGLLYPSFMSRGEIRAAIAASPDGKDWPRDPDHAPHYPGPERDWPEAKRRAEIATGRPHALRLDMAKAMDGLPLLAWREINPFDPAGGHNVAADPAAWGDVIIARSDVPASYHLSVVVDDAFQNITHVLRGVDLAPATGVHRVLQHLLGLPAPDYFHHRLLLDESGEKLSKRAGSESLRDLRHDGHSPDDVHDMLQPYLDRPAPNPPVASE